MSSLEESLRERKARLLSLRQKVNKNASEEKLSDVPQASSSDLVDREEINRIPDEPEQDTKDIKGIYNHNEEHPASEAEPTTHEREELDVPKLEQSTSHALDDKPAFETQPEQNTKQDLLYNYDLKKDLQPYYAMAERKTRLAINKLLQKKYETYVNE